MSSFKQRVERLIKNSTNIEARRVGESVMEMLAHVPENKLSVVLIEKLDNLSVKDGGVMEFLATERRLRAVLDMGIGTAVKNIRNSPVAQTATYTIAEFDRYIADGIADYRIVENFLSAFKSYEWDSVVKENLAAVEATMLSLSEDIVLARSLDVLENVRGPELYVGVVEAIQRYREVRNKESRNAMLTEMSKCDGLPQIAEIKSAVSVYEQKSANALNIKPQNGNSTVRTVYSYTMIGENEDIFNVDNVYYRRRGNEIERLTVAEANSLPINFREINTYVNSDITSIDESGMTIYCAQNAKIRMSIDDAGTKSVTINGQPATMEAVNQYLSTVRMVDRGFRGEVRIINNMFECLDTLVELDFAKVVESKYDAGLRITLMRAGETVCANKVCETVGENRFYKNLNPVQTRALVLEHLQFDLSEGLAEYLDKTAVERSAMAAKKVELTEAIIRAQNDIRKLNEAIALNFLPEDTTPQKATLENLRDEITATLESMQATLVRVDAAERAFENVDSESCCTVGDYVAVNGRGKGKVLSLDTINQSGLVMFDNGDTDFVSLADVSPVGDEADDAMAANDPDGEMTDPAVDGEAPSEAPSEAPAEEEAISEEPKTISDPESPEEDEEEEISPEDDESNESTEEPTEGESVDETADDVETSEEDTVEEKTIEGMGDETVAINGQDVPAEDAQQPKYITGRVSYEFPSNVRGNTVQVRADQYAKGGDDDLVDTLTEHGELAIPKKYLEIVEDVQTAETENIEESDVAAPTAPSFLDGAVLGDDGSYKITDASGRTYSVRIESE
jgi:hypothetical protein